MNPKYFIGCAFLSRATVPAILAGMLAGCLQVAFAQQPAESIPAPIAARATKPQVHVTSSLSDDQYRIGPGDLLTVQVFNRTQLSREEQVDMRGMISMPLIEGEIRASCRTEKELAEEIARLYRDGQLLKNPMVYVSVKDYQSQPVAVMGAVNSPGRFQLRRRVRLLELLVFHAGGPSPKAGRIVQILSTSPSDTCEGRADKANAKKSSITDDDDGVLTYDLKELLRGGDDKSLYVHQGDIINIPDAEEVIIVGNVARPAVVPIVEPITLARALAMVGGTLPNSKRDKIRVTRQISGSSATTEFLVDMKAPDKSQGEGFLLQGGDIVEVSTKTGLQAILRGMASTIIPMATRLPIVIP
ncbi:MAG: polysaccharide biosynthesis/export family protein [Pyrinomonadaceae bacterium]|nr:polysaccharide biosynthesis/export family protein [Pyrinomonadaceae bacterium]